MEFPNPLNKFEKRDLVIKLHNEGKTYSEIAHIAHVSVRDIKPILKAYEKKIRLEQMNKEEEQGNNHQTTKTTKKLSLSSRAFILYRKNKTPSEVKVLLDIPFSKAKKFWFQFLNLERMDECYEFYNDFRYEIPNLLSIVTFIKRNNVSGKDIANVLRTTNDIINLNQTYSHLKMEINGLEQKRMRLSYYSQSSYSLQSLPLNKPNYNYYYY